MLHGHKKIIPRELARKILPAYESALVEHYIRRERTLLGCIRQIAGDGVELTPFLPASII